MFQNVFNGLPAFRFLLPLIFGILIAQCSGIQIRFAIYVLAVVALIYLACVWFRWDGSNLLFLLIAGCAYLSVQVKTKFTNQEVRLIEENNFNATALRIRYKLSETGTHGKFLAELVGGRTERGWVELNGNVYLYADDSVSFSPGEVILTMSKLLPIRPPLNPNQLDYGKILKRRKVYGSVFLKDVVLLQVASECRSVFLFSQKIRAYFARRIEKEFPENQAAVLSALLLGDKSMINAEIRTDFSRAGIMHLLCVSGLHVGLIYLILKRIMDLLIRKKNSMVKTVVILLFIWLYACISGFGPAIFRAALMISLVMAGSLLNKGFTTWNLLAAAASVILLVDPLMLLDVGFQLSFAAIAGILLIYVPVKKKLPSFPFIVGKVNDIILISLSAQIMTFPLAIFYFGQFPVYFLVANIIALPLATWILYLGIAFLIVGSTLTPMLSIGLEFLLSFSTSISAASAGMLDDIHIDLSETILLYLFILVMIAVFYFKTKYMLYICCTVVFCWFTYDIYNISSRPDTKEVVVYYVKSTSLIDLYHDGFASRLWYQKVENRSAVDFATKGNLRKLKIKNFRRNVVVTSDASLLRLCGDIYYLQTDLNGSDQMNISRKIEVLVIGDRSPAHANKIKEILNPQLVVLDTSLPWYRCNKLALQLKKAGIRTYSVQRSGAFTYRFTLD